MRDPRNDDLPLLDVARKYWGHSEKTVQKWVGNRNNMESTERYPFPIYRLAGQKSPWMVRAADFKRYRDQAYKDHAGAQAIA